MHASYLMKILRVFALHVCAPMSAGVALVMQGALGGLLGEIFGDYFWGAAILNVIALLMFLGFSLIGPSFEVVRLAVKEGLNSDPLACLCFFSGLCGAVSLCCGVVIPQTIGFGLYAVTYVCFEVLASLVVESRGFCWIPKEAKRVEAWLGSVIVITGTVLFQLRSFVAHGLHGVKTSVVLGCVSLAATAGTCLVFLSAGNRKLTSLLKTPFRSLSISLFCSTSVAFVAATVSKPNPTFSHFVGKKDSWKLLAGVFSFYNVLMLVILPSKIGLNSAIGWMIFGQLSTAFIIDSIGGFGFAQIPVEPSRIVGLSMVLIGVAIVQHSRCNSSSAGTRHMISGATGTDSSSIGPRHSTANCPDTHVSSFADDVRVGMSVSAACVTTTTSTSTKSTSTSTSSFSTSSTSSTSPFTQTTSTGTRSSGGGGLSTTMQDVLIAVGVAAGGNGILI